MMADALDTIMSRRSIRAYTDKPVAKETVKKLLEAAMCAPSARHEEPWHFIVISDRAMLDAILKVHPYAQMLKTAQLAILVCGEQKPEAAGESYVPVDCGNATMNLLHAANALGLGAVWVGIYPRKERMDEMRGLLSIPKDAFPFALVPIGYPAEKKGRENRYKEERVHYNKW